jgi:hypothetical protein
MTDTCGPEFGDVAAALGGIDCATANPVVSLRDPLDLANWTLPVVELLMVAGAVAALVHAVLRWRRRGDPTNLALWFATVGYVLLLEPPLYFPDRFGLQDEVGLIFVHNVFTVQFMFDRLPLYIVALYPALTYLAYALVQRVGVLQRHGALVGAACVGFTFHALYEVFDHIGPNLLWWTWNPDAPTNEPWLASVPLTSAAIFAGASPFGIALLTQWLVARRAARGPVPAASMVLRVLGVGALTPLVMIVCSAPAAVFSRQEPPDLGGDRTVLYAEIALLAAVGLWAVATTVRDNRRDAGEPTADGGGFLAHYPAVGGAVYLAVFAVLWLTADGGGPAGSAGYAAACGVAGALVVAAAALAPGRQGAPAPAAATEPAAVTG